MVDAIFGEDLIHDMRRVVKSQIRRFLRFLRRSTVFVSTENSLGGVSRRKTGEDTGREGSRLWMFFFSGS